MHVTRHLPAQGRPKLTNNTTKGSIPLDSKLIGKKEDGKLVVNATIKFAEAAGLSRNMEELALSEASKSAAPVEDEPIRPFVYRAPTGQASGSDRSHPKRRTSDADCRGN